MIRICFFMILLRKSSEALERVAQGNGGITTAGGVMKRLDLVLRDKI